MPVQTDLLSGKTFLLIPASGGGGAVATSGTYTPTITNDINVNFSFAYSSQYIQVGNIVTVSGRINIEASTDNTQTRLTLTLPVASNFIDPENCTGTFVNGDWPGLCGSIFASGTEASLNYISNADVTPLSFYYTYTYRII